MASCSLIPKLLPLTRRQNRLRIEYVSLYIHDQCFELPECRPPPRHAFPILHGLRCQEHIVGYGENREIVERFDHSLLILEVVNSISVADSSRHRSEERRVGKECRSRGSAL